MKHKHRANKGRSKLLWKEHFRTSKKRFIRDKMGMELAMAFRAAGYSVHEFADAVMEISNALRLLKKRR